MVGYSRAIFEKGPTPEGKEEMRMPEVGWLERCRTRREKEGEKERGRERERERGEKARERERGRERARDGEGGREGVRGFLG